jgi:hypothetical protein
MVLMPDVLGYRSPPNPNPHHPRRSLGRPLIYLGLFSAGIVGTCLFGGLFHNEEVFILIPVMYLMVGGWLVSCFALIRAFISRLYR